MNVVLLAAGRGSRLGGLTRDIPKPFIKLNDRPLIHYFLDALIVHGIEDIYIVVGYKRDYFYNNLGDSYKSLSINYIENKIWEKTNNIYSLKLALDIVGTDDLFLFEADLYLSRNNYRLIFENSDQNFIVVSKYRDNIPGTVVKKESSSFRLILKKEQGSNFIYKDVYKTVNIYKFSSVVIEKLKKLIYEYIEENSSNEYYEVVINELALRFSFNLLEINHDWYEVDTLTDLKELQKIFIKLENNKYEVLK